MKLAIRPLSDLERYLAENRLTFRAAGRLFGCSHEWVRKIAQDDVKATGPAAQRIMAAVEAHKSTFERQSPPADVTVPCGAARASESQGFFSGAAR